MRFLTWCAAIPGLCFSAFALAGVQYAVVSDTEGGSNTTSEFLFDGKNMKSTFTSSSDPVMKAGMYMLAHGSEAMYMVNPNNRKYARFSAKDMQGMQQDAQQMAAGFGGSGAKMEIKDFKVTKDLDEAGPTLLGLPTRHLRYTISYKSVMGSPSSPMTISNDMEMVEEFWATKEFVVPLPEEARNLTAPAADLGGLGDVAAKMQDAQRQMAEHGFVLKRVSTSKASMGGMHGAMMKAMTMGKGAGGSKSTMEITALNRNATFAPGTFDLPKGYAEVDFMNVMTGGSMPDLNAVPGQDQAQGMPDLSKEPPQ